MKNLTESLASFESCSFSRGGFAVLHKAELQSYEESKCRTVAVKFPDLRSIHLACREGSQSNVIRSKTFQRWQREIKAAQSVSHPNIIDVLGFCDNPDAAYKEFIGIVLPFCSNGDARTYVNAHPEADRTSILCDIAEAINAIHSSSPPVVHGDIKASNILIDDHGHAYLADFGLARICDSKGFTTQSVMGTCRWMAAELLHASASNQSVRTSPASDIWAFGMTILEILHGNHPFAELKSDGAVFVGIVFRNARPERPRDPRITDMIWRLLEHCWQQDPSVRPDARRVGLVLDLTHNGNHNVDSNAMTAIINAAWDDEVYCLRNRNNRNPSSLPYMCKWPHCSKRFETLDSCIEHETAEFAMRSAFHAFR